MHDSKTKKDEATIKSVKKQTRHVKRDLNQIKINFTVISMSVFVPTVKLGLGDINAWLVGGIAFDLVVQYIITDLLLVKHWDLELQNSNTITYIVGTKKIIIINWLRGVNYLKMMKYKDQTEMCISSYPSLVRHHPFVLSTILLLAFMLQFANTYLTCHFFFRITVNSFLH